MIAPWARIKTNGLNVMRVIIALFMLVSIGFNAHAATTILPPGEQCFVVSGGAPAVSGSVNMFYVGTVNPKTTWQNAAQTVANTNPIALDGNGCAIIYGVGTYRQQLYDGPVVGGLPTGNLVFDLPTTDTSAYNSVFWAGLAGGTPNIITITDTGFNATDGTVINFLALMSNTGATTLNPSGYGAIPIEKQTTGGPVSLTGGEIVGTPQGNAISVIYSATYNAFLLLNPPIQSVSGSSTPLCGASALSVKVTSASLATVTANTILTTNVGGIVYNRSTFSATLNTSTVGANGLSTDIPSGVLADSTWYYVWGIDNGTAAASLLSISSTAPVLPVGYTTQCRLGSLVTDASANLFRTIQLGKRAQYIVGTDPAVARVIANGIAGTYSTTSPVLAAVSISSFVPPTAATIQIGANYQYGGGSSTAILVAPNSAWGGTNNGPEGSNGAVWPLWIFSGDTSISMVLESTSIYWASNGSSSAIAALGWEDQVNAN